MDAEFLRAYRRRRRRGERLDSGSCFERESALEVAEDSSDDPSPRSAKGDPAWRSVLELIVGQSSHVGSVRAHNVQIAVWLRIERSEEGRILEAAAFARKSNPLGLACKFLRRVLRTVHAMHASADRTFPARTCLQRGARPLPFRKRAAPAALSVAVISLTTCR
jgi:hypothetical protein